MGFFELILVGSAVGLTSTYLTTKTLFDAAGATKNGNERPLNSDQQRRLIALKEVLESDIVASTNAMQVQVNQTNVGCFYAFHYDYRMRPFISFSYEEKSQSVVNVSVSSLNENHKEVKVVLDKLIKKVIEQHAGKQTVVSSVSEPNEVKEKFNELLLRVQHLNLQTEIEASHLQDIKENIEPMLRDVMSHFEELNAENKETFTSKTLDIFYSLEKKLKVYEMAVEKKKKESLESYFSAMEKQAESLAEEHG